MNTLKIIVIVLLGLFICVSIYLQIRNIYRFSYREIFMFPVEITDKEIPKTIIQTYHNKSNIPDKVYKNIQKYAPEYEHIVYDDKECIDFLTKFEESFKHLKKGGVNVVDRFNSFRKGAHKADLFRYCYLYQHGGIYMDIKTVLIKPVSEIFTENSLYTVIDLNKNIYQGVICVFPKHPLIGTLVNQALCSSNIDLLLNYHLFLQFFYKCIVDSIKTIPVIGKNQYGNFNIILFEEKNFQQENYVYDRYGLNTFICDKKGDKIIKTRYSDFPW